MAIKPINELKKGKIKIDLTGPDGNAFCLLGNAKRLCNQLNKDYDAIKKDMTSSDYEHLIKVFDREFGAFVDLYK